MKMRWFKVICLMGITVWLAGCATLEEAKKPPLEVTSRGTAIYDEEFEFALPPPGWKFVTVETTEGSEEFAFGFLKVESGPFPTQSMFAYDEDPFGCSTTFEKREKEFFRRFLWNAALNVRVLEKKKVEVVGREGLEVIAEGKDPIKKEKARSKVVFGKRGDRVIAFYITQWRPIDGHYDSGPFEVFDKFVKSFKYLKKSFYETL
jgi:hypothetical protein